MEKQIFFNSSLPRSGSTVFQNIIGQNPKFYVTPTSGFLELIYGARANYLNAPEFKAQDQAEMDRAFVAFCRNGMQGYFSELTKKPFVLDKNRGWGISMTLADRFHAAPKMICIVRDLRAIFASMEKNYRKNPLRDTHVQNPTQLVGTTVTKRIAIWASGVPVGLAMDRLRDIIDQGLDRQMLFIRYEDLVDNPESEIARFYEYTGVAPFVHNFANIDQITVENDVIHGVYGDHRIRKTLEALPKDYEEVLGYENCMNIKKSYDWFFKKFNYI